jgi:hypothetical protein
VTITHYQQVVREAPIVENGDRRKMDDVSRHASPPPAPDFDKFNFLPHVTNLLNLIHSDADTNVVSTEVCPKREIDSGCATEAGVSRGSK